MNSYHRMMWVVAFTVAIILIGPDVFFALLARYWPEIPFHALDLESAHTRILTIVAAASLGTMFLDVLYVIAAPLFASTRVVGIHGPRPKPLHNVQAGEARGLDAEATGG